MNNYLYLAGLLHVLFGTLCVKHVNTNAIQGRIVSGSEAAEGQFSWQVILKKDKYDHLWGGGSIISNTWVLTAAHCTSGLQSLLLVFGTIDLYDNTNSMTCNQFFIHPQYDSTKLANDISLIKLPIPLIFTFTVQSIPLVNWLQASNSFDGYSAYISGFGVKDDEYLDYSGILLWAEVEIIENSVCANDFDGGIIKETNICSRGNDTPNSSICSGDSGGALVTVVNNTQIQIGINSFVVEDRCTEGFPSVYVRISSFLDYISNITGMVFN